MTPVEPLPPDAFGPLAKAPVGRPGPPLAARCSYAIYGVNEAEWLAGRLREGFDGLMRGEDASFAAYPSVQAMPDATVRCEAGQGAQTGTPRAAAEAAGGFWAALWDVDEVVPCERVGFFAALGG